MRKRCSRHFQPGEGPSRGLLHDCENRWIVCSSSQNSSQSAQNRNSNLAPGIFTTCGTTTTSGWRRATTGWTGPGSPSWTRPWRTSARWNMCCSRIKVTLSHFVDCKVWVCVLIISGKEWSALSSFPSTSLTFPEVRPKAQVLKMNQS